MTDTTPEPTPGDAATPNPVEQVRIEDLFKKDPDTLTDAEIETVVTYLREQRVKYEELEQLGKRPTRAKKDKPPADPLEVKSGNVKAKANA